MATPFSHYKSTEIFSGTLGQLTLQSVRWSDLAEFLTPLSSHACHRYLQVWKGLDEKTAEKKWQHCFSHYNPMGAICGNQSSDPIWLKTSCSLSSTPLMLLIKFHCDRSAGCRDIHVWKRRKTHRWMDAQTPAWLVYYKLTMSLRLRWAKNILRCTPRKKVVQQNLFIVVTFF